MTRLSAVLILICVLAACVLPAQAAPTGVPYGSFLTKPVVDADDLAQLIRRDKVVAQRFANFYGMNNDALADYIEKYGQVITVSKSGNYVEYFIDNAGKVRKHHKLLRPGTRILVVKGTPVLDLRCGNPMNKVLPQIVEKVEPIVQETPPPPAPEPVLQPQVLQQPPEPVVEVLAEQPMEYPAALISSPVTKELAWLLPGLLGLGTLSGGGSTETVVPEPAGLLVFGLGGTGLAFACYRKLRSRATHSS